MFGQPNIAKLRARGDVSGLMKAMDSRDSSVVVQAIEALGELNSREAAVGLAVKTSSRDQEIRQAAERVFARWGSSPVDACITALGDPNMTARFVAAAALGEFGDPSAIDSLISALEDGSPLVRDRARHSLTQLGHAVD